MRLVAGLIILGCIATAIAGLVIFIMVMIQLVGPLFLYMLG